MTYTSKTSEDEASRLFNELPSGVDNVGPAFAADAIVSTSTKQDKSESERSMTGEREE
jgi:hypothetical protein